MVTRVKSLKELENEIKKLKSNTLVVFVISGKKYHEVNIFILKKLIQLKKFSGIYISLNRPFKNLVKYLKEKKIDTDKIFFIDCVSSFFGEAKLAENCLFVPSPSRLTDIGIALDEAIRRMKNPSNKFLFLDSVSTLLIYNDLKVVAQFIHYLATKLRKFGVIGILMTVEKEIEERFLNFLIQISDKIIEVV